MVTLKERYKKAGAIATYACDAWGGIEILDIEYGIDDYVIACINYLGERTGTRRHKIYTSTGGRLYIRKYGRRYYLDDFIRVGAV